MAPRLVVVGATYLDMCFRLDSAIQPSGIVLAGKAALLPGGKGFNQALAARRLGADVTFISTMGDDACSRMAVNHLRNAGFRDRDLLIRERPGALPLCASFAHGNDVGGAASRQTLPAPMDEIASAAAILATADVVLATYDYGIDALSALLANLPRHRRRPITVLNPAPIPDFVEIARITGFDWLVPNWSEARRMLPATDPIALAARLAALTSADICITRGEDGYVHASPDRPPAFYPAVPVLDLVDPTGASDAFCAALVVSLAERRTRPAALAAAAAAGSYAASVFGTSTSMPERTVLGSILDSDSPVEPAPVPTAQHVDLGTLQPVVPVP